VETVALRDIHGLWDIIQTNGFVVPINVANFNKSDGSFSLEAEQGAGGVRGNGNGNVRGEMVDFIVNWDNQTRGAYHGAFGQDGVINGSTFDLANPGSFAGWHSSRSF
jgi:hypothetical protein